MSLPNVFAQQPDTDRPVRTSGGPVKSMQLDPLRRPSAGLDLMNLVQRVFLTPEPCRAVAFAGIDLSDKSSLICLEAARILSSSVKQDVLLIDADLEHSSPLEPYAKIKDRGLVTAMESNDAIRIHSTRMQETNLFFMPPGPSAGRPLLTGAMRNFLGRALKEFHYVLIHSPSHASSSDCVTFAQAADGMVLVLEAGRTRKAVAVRTVHQLESAGATLLGTVLSDTTQPIPGFIYNRL